jgi:pyrophosphate--fructose-6-phosphate 1-phosphotransferase
MSENPPFKKVALLTGGGLAPCLSSAIGYLVERYTEFAPEAEIIGYIGGYRGLLLGESATVDDEARRKTHILLTHGGSPLGNSRVKLTNVKDCVARGLVKEGQDPLQVAAEQLVKDGIDVLHTIGGDDTNTSAADLAAYLKEHDYHLTVIGLPKTVDNDVFPIRQSLGASTAAEEGAKYFENVVAEHNANPRMLIVHEVMGRNCGWLTARTAHEYRQRLDMHRFIPSIGLTQEMKDVHGVYIPEMAFDIASEATRLKKVMDELDCVNIFISEGAGTETIVKEIEGRGEEVPRDAFGHVKLDAVNPGQWFGKHFAKMIGAEKVLVQKSGYYSRAAPSNVDDLVLIKRCVAKAVEAAFNRNSGVVGEDDDQHGALGVIDFKRIAGGKPFNIDTWWFEQLLQDIGQPKGARVDYELMAH